MRRSRWSLFSLALLVCSGLASAGCVSSAPEPAQSGPGPEAAEPLGFGRAVSAELDCAAGACRRWYRIEQPQAGELQVDVRAVADGDTEVPDFDVRLEDERGALLWGFAPAGGRTREVRRVLGPGSYLLLVSAPAAAARPLAFEIVAGVVPREASLPGAGAAASSPDARARPERPEVWVHAEIVRVEGRGGLPSFVVLDVGSRDELRTGFGGELLEQGEEIAAFELVEVEDRSSRARLLRPPVAAITYTTRARVRVPLAAAGDH